ncbi:DnaJ domain-containing protein [Dipodascopsis uninucleata]
MSIPDHYATLGCDSGSSQTKIRNAYKKAALLTHPDRFKPLSKEAKSATERFQAVSDAYYVLGDATRRAQYDRERETTQSSGRTRSKSSSYSQYFENDDEREKAYRDEFMRAFEEMLRDAHMNSSDMNNEASSSSGSSQHPNDNNSGDYHSVAGKLRIFTVAGGASGAMLGFILANIPGALAGLAVGAKLGNIRDQKGKSVYEVYQELPGEAKAKVLAELAQKLFANVPLSS